MKNSDLLRAFLLGLAFTTALPGQVDAREIIRRAVAADELNWKAARNYTFLQRVELRWLDAQGKVKLSHVQTYDVTLQEGTPYRQLVQREDSALSASEEKAEHERLAKSIAERRHETDVKRANRLSEYDRRPDWQSERGTNCRKPSSSGWPERARWTATASLSLRPCRARDTSPDPAPPSCFAP